MASKQKFLLFEIYNGTLFYAVYRNGDTIEHSCVGINTDLVHNISAQDDLICTISDITKSCNISYLHTRTYWSTQSEIEQDTLSLIRNRFYTRLGINLNIMPESTRTIYLRQSNNLDTILYGLCAKEFQKVVVCGSFRKHLDLVKKVYDYCSDRGITVLSPRSLQLDSIFNESFVLFHGEKITDERQTYWIEHKHTEAIRDADAIIICNNEGYVGPTTIYEIGFAQALGKHIVFVDEKRGEFDINFPRDTGLIGF